MINKYYYDNKNCDEDDDGDDDNDDRHKQNWRLVRILHILIEVFILYIDKN